MLTADTITDEQIRALWRAACGTGLSDVDPDLMYLCTRALNGNKPSRARVAEILNARASKAAP